MAMTRTGRNPNEGLVRADRARGGLGVSGRRSESIAKMGIDVIEGS